ncbi:MAG: hypothetical protein ACREQH_01485, partial [Candidatus Binatus sp.]
MSDLFPAADYFQRIPAQDADIRYLPRLELGCPDDEILHQLIEDTPWRQERAVVWAKEYRQ